MEGAWTWTDKLDGRIENSSPASIIWPGFWICRDKDGNDLYPEIRKQSSGKESRPEKHTDMIRFEYIKYLGYYCTESSEHNAEYNPFFIKSRYPEMIDDYNILWMNIQDAASNRSRVGKRRRENILNDGKITHTRSREYASYIMEAVVTGRSV